MELKVDTLYPEKFGELNEYISRKSNRTEKLGLKVKITNMKIGGNPKGTEQVYEGIEILVNEHELTQSELHELMDIVYCCKSSKGGGVGGV